MANEISKGRILNTKEGFSGVKAVSFIPYISNLTTDANDYWQGAGMTGSAFRYEVKNSGVSYEEVGTPDRDKGTTVYVGTLNVVLPILDKATRDEVKIMAYKRPQIVIEKWDGTNIIAGLERGCEMKNVKMGTGGATSDMSGFTLVFETEERKPMVMLGATGSVIYNAAINTTGAINPTV